MSDTQNNTVEGQENTAQAGQAEKTFTQEEVNAMIAKRVNTEKSKFADYEDLKKKALQYDALEEANKTDLQKLQDANTLNATLQAKIDAMQKATDIQNIRMKVAAETGVPFVLIMGDTEEDCTNYAKAILKFSKPDYPDVKDKGENVKIGGTSTRDQFSDWFGKLV